MSLRRCVPAIAILVALVGALAACSSGSSPAPSTSPSASPTANPRVTRTVVTKLRTAVDRLTSAHLVIDAGLLGGTTVGDFTFANGSATASDVTVHSGGSAVELVTADGTTYRKLATPTNGKTYTRLDTTGAGSVSLAGAVAVIDAVSSLDAIVDLIAHGTTTATDDGTANVDGVATHHYDLTLDAGASGTGQLQQLLTLIGTASLPVGVWLDAQGRPVRIVLRVPLGGQSLPLSIDASRFDAPVTIKAPAASAVTGG